MPSHMIPQPPSFSPGDLEPGRIRVFGIMHIVFGALGLLGGSFFVAMLLVVDPLVLWFQDLVESELPSGSAVPPEAEMMIGAFDALRILMKELALLNWIHALTSLVVAVLILVAGIRLVKKRRNAVQSSNLYSWASVGRRLIYLVLFLTTGVQAMRRYHAKIEELTGAASASAPGSLNMMQLQEVFGAATTVLSTFVALVYPILALVMLNKPLVKGYLDKNGA